jgi:hypothetical protein
MAEREWPVEIAGDSRADGLPSSSDSWLAAEVADGLKFTKDGDSEHLL